MLKAQSVRVWLEVAVVAIVAAVGVAAFRQEPSLWVSFGILVLGVAIVELGLWRFRRNPVPFPPRDEPWRKKYERARWAWVACVAVVTAVGASVTVGAGAPNWVYYAWIFGGLAVVGIGEWVLRRRLST